MMQEDWEAKDKPGIPWKMPSEGNNDDSEGVRGKQFELDKNGEGKLSWEWVGKIQSFPVPQKKNQEWLAINVT